MDTMLLRTLRDGIQEEITHYEQLLDLTTREQEILAEETYSSELANVAAEKLKVMREINDLTMRIGPLKVRWKLEECGNAKGDGTEISPLLEELGSILEKILDVDERNQQILARLVKATGVNEANSRLNAASAERAYNQNTSGE